MLVDVWHIGAPAGSFGSDGRWPKGAAFHGIVYTDACKEDGSVPETIIQTLWVPESSSFIRKAQGDFFFASNYVNIWTCKSTSYTTWHVVVSIPIEHCGKDRNP
jgi:hypothetical protein